MNDVPIQIRNPEVIRAIRELAARKRLPITEVVGEAVSAELGRLDCLKEAEVSRRLAGSLVLVQPLVDYDLTITQQSARHTLVP